jgi:predicted enzyme related to lactoylglutathione lyase
VVQPQLAVFEVGGVRLTVHLDDGFDSGGRGNGTVPYWDVADVDAAVERCVARGAVAHRGPKTIFSGERLCQLRDPFGNLLGLRQPPRRGLIGAADGPGTGGRG